MDNIATTRIPIGLAGPAYYQLLHNLITYLPPPVVNTPEAMLARNQAAIAKVADLLPVDTNESDLAAQCVAARAQAEDVMRLIRRHAADINVVMRLNAQYTSMVRASLSAHARLQRVQALRRKHEPVADAHSTDEWTRHIVASSMQQALDAGPMHKAPPAAPEPVASEHPALPPPQPAEAARDRPVEPDHEPLSMIRRARAFQPYVAPPPGSDAGFDNDDEDDEDDARLDDARDEQDGPSGDRYQRVG